MSVFGEGSIGSRRLILLARAFLLTPAVPRLWQNDAVKIPCLPAALLVFTLPAALGQKPASTQKPAANAVGPVQAELLANLDVRHLRDVDDEAIGNDSSHTFVVKVVRSVKPIPPNINFTSADLDSAEVRVYRASDAKRLLAVSVRNPAPSHRDYAIAPDGSALAVLSGSEIQFFPVPTE